jgi:ABC-2 type transport system permease protein
MQVFKVFFKIIKKNLPMLSIYIVIFITIAVLMTVLGGAAPAADFTQARAPVAVINRDTDSELVRGFTAFIGERSDLVELRDEPEAIKDALFFRRADVILTIPPGFTDAVMSGKKAAVEKLAVPGSAASFYTDMLVDNYLNTARVYVHNVEGVPQAALISRVAADLSEETEVRVRAAKGSPAIGASVNFYFNYSAYSLLAILILGVSAFMLVINKPDLKLRNLCAPVSPRSVNTQSLLAILVFAAAVWGIVVGCAFVLYGSEMLSVGGALLAANLFVFALVALCLSYLLGSLIRNRNAQNAAANTISLGMSFLCGVFVPQSMLGDTVLSIARFLPAYWFVKNNNDIGNIASFTGANLVPIVTGILVQLAFAAALAAVAFALTRQRRNRPLKTPANK